MMIHHDKDDNECSSGFTSDLSIICNLIKAVLLCSYTAAEPHALMASFLPQTINNQ